MCLFCDTPTSLELERCLSCGYIESIGNHHYFISHYMGEAHYTKWADQVVVFSGAFTTRRMSCGSPWHSYDGVYNHHEFAASHDWQIVNAEPTAKSQLAVLQIPTSPMFVGMQLETRARHGGFVAGYWLTPALHGRQFAFNIQSWSGDTEIWTESEIDKVFRPV